jgi:cytochrome b
VNNEEPNHNNGSPSGTLVVWPVIREAGDNGCDDEMASSHADSTGNEDGLATPAVNIHDRRNYSALAYVHGNLRNNLLVAMNMTIPTTPVAKRLTELELKPRPLKMVGA